MTAVESRAKILVVDDVKGQRLAIEAALAELQEQVIAVASGADALRFLLEEDVAVILLDVNMPELDGFETAALIRRRPRSRHTPIIFVTGDTDQVAAARGYSLGAVDYLFNPFRPDVLRAKVRVFVELSKMHERMRREAEQLIVLSRAQAARAAAEEESRRFKVLAEASGILTRSLDATTLTADLLNLFVPLIGDVAVIARSDVHGHQSKGADLCWLDVDARGGVSGDPITTVGGAELQESIERVIAGGKAETLVRDPDEVWAAIVPMVARGRTLGAIALACPNLPRHYDAGEIDLICDIAGRAAIALDNSRLYQEIQERDRQKDEFLAMLSHELRNPLGAITAAVRVLELAGVSDDRGRRARAVIGRQSLHLARMVDDLLDVARLTAGQIVVERAPIDLANVAARALDALRVSGRLEHHVVTERLEPTTVEADFARMEQVITNLLVNALKYTDRGGRIELAVASEGDDAIVRVRDTGIGITAEMLPRLFDLFAQGRQALDRSQGGLGIGLTLVRRLVELQGGRVEAASEGPGRGSTFTIRLPRVSSPAAGNFLDRQVKLDDPPRLRVLVVEDNRDAREMLATLLRLAGHDVEEAADGFEALAVAGQVKPQVALIDIGLPGLDGLEVASRLRATREGDQLLLVAVTGYGQMADKRRALEAGFDLHITKPVDGERLDEVVTFAARRCGRRDVGDRRTA